MQKLIFFDKKCSAAQPRLDVALQLCDIARERESILQKTPYDLGLYGVLFESDASSSDVPNFSIFRQAEPPPSGPHSRPRSRST